MNLATFERRARAIWDSLPAAHRVGVSEVLVSPELRWDSELEALPLLGECMADPALADVVEAPIQSFITVYYGSFAFAAQQTEGFDWEEELWVTITHELRHHLDWRSGKDSLGELEDVQRENLRRVAGEPFDALFYRRGERIARAVYRVDEDVFLEVDVPPAQWSLRTTHLSEVWWGGWALVGGPIEADDGDSDSVFVLVDDLYEEDEGADQAVPDWGDIVLVLRRRGRLARMLGGGLRVEWLAPRDEP